MMTLSRKYDIGQTKFITGGKQEDLAHLLFEIMRFGHGMYLGHHIRYEDKGSRFFGGSTSRAHHEGHATRFCPYFRILDAVDFVAKTIKRIVILP